MPVKKVFDSIDYKTELELYENEGLCSIYINDEDNNVISVKLTSGDLTELISELQSIKKQIDNI